ECSTSTCLQHHRWFPDTVLTEIHTLSLHDALPIYLNFLGGIHVGGPEAGSIRPSTNGRSAVKRNQTFRRACAVDVRGSLAEAETDRKSTRLNSSHGSTSYAVFCLKKKKQLHGQRVY